MSAGEDRIPLFGSDSAELLMLKRRCIELIDWCETKKQTSPDLLRVLTVAQNKIEEAAMWIIRGASPGTGV